MSTRSSVAPIPNPTPALFLLTALAFLIWHDAIGIVALVVASVLVVPLTLVSFSKSPQIAIVGLILASIAPRLFVEIGSLKVRPEHIVIGLVTCIIPFVWKKRERPIQWIKPDYWLMAYIGLLFFSSLFTSIAPSQTAKWAVQQVLAILPYFWLRVLITDRAHFRKVFDGFLAVGAAACAYAMVCFYSNVFFGTTFGMETEQYSTDSKSVPGTFGLQFEPNILGACSGALAVMMLVMYLRERKRKYLLGYAFFGFATMAISLSRAALGASALILGFTLVVALRRDLLDRKICVNIAAATLAATLLVGPFVLAHYTQRFSTVDVSDYTEDPNTLTRAVQTVAAVEEIGKHPIFGGGAASFQLAFDWEDFGEGWGDIGWIGNTELRVLHDTGAVGFLTFIIFLVYLVWLARKVLKRESSPELIALLAGAAVYCITFQATEGTLLAFTWVHVGLIGCGVAVMSSQEKPADEARKIAAS